MTHPVTTARRHLDARVDVRGWTTDEHGRVDAARPTSIRDRAAWKLAVAVWRRGRESPEEAAQRLALYLNLHAERYGQAPKLSAVTDHDRSPEQD